MLPSIGDNAANVCLANQKAQGSSSSCAALGEEYRETLCPLAASGYEREIMVYSMGMKKLAIRLHGAL